jgi:hypothetical protein
VVTNSCAFYLCTRGCGCVERPAFPAPSDPQKARLLSKNSGAGREIAESYLTVMSVLFEN